MFKDIYNKKRKCICGIILLLFSSITLSNTIKILSNYWSEQSSLVVFNYKAGDIPFLTSVRLNFFAVDDCQEKFLGRYKSEGKFDIKPNHSFALLTAQTYQIAAMLFDEDILKDIRSILISFRGKNNSLPRFLSGCEDQGINCCIAIQCYSDAGICLPTYQFGSQTFIFFRNY